MKLIQQFERGLFLFFHHRKSEIRNGRLTTIRIVTKRAMRLLVNETTVDYPRSPLFANPEIMYMITTEIMILP